MVDFGGSGDAVSLGGGHEEEDKRPQHLEVIQTLHGSSS